MNSEWVADLHLKSKTTKLPADYAGEALGNLRLLRKWKDKPEMVRRYSEHISGIWLVVIYFLWCCNGGCMTLCICQNPQNFIAQRVKLIVSNLKQSFISLEGPRGNPERDKPIELSETAVHASWHWISKEAGGRCWEKVCHRWRSQVSQGRRLE